MAGPRGLQPRKERQGQAGWGAGDGSPFIPCPPPGPAAPCPHSRPLPAPGLAPDSPKAGLATPRSPPAGAAGHRAWRALPSPTASISRRGRPRKGGTSEDAFSVPWPVNSRLRSLTPERLSRRSERTQEERCRADRFALALGPRLQCSGQTSPSSSLQRPCPLTSLWVVTEFVTTVLLTYQLYDPGPFRCQGRSQLALGPSGPFAWTLLLGR